MAKLDQQEQEAGAAAAGQPQDAGISAKGAARRRFAKAGLGASGVLMTLASQPGMAATVCAAPSGFLSGTFASHAPKGNVCQGGSPGYWKNHTDQWPSAHTDGTAKFSYVFPCNLRTAALKDFTLFQVVDAQQVSESADPDRVAAHLICALLNARSNRVSASVLSEERVRDIWTEYASTGYFTPSAGAKKWNGYEITQYLKSTMI